MYLSVRKMFFVMKDICQGMMNSVPCCSVLLSALAYTGSILSVEKIVWSLVFDQNFKI